MVAFSEYTFPPWSPKYTELPTAIGEDSVPAGITFDHAIRPVFIDSATNRPLPGEWPCADSTGRYSKPCLTPSAGEAAASVPTLVSHTL